MRTALWQAQCLRASEHGRLALTAAAVQGSAWILQSCGNRVGCDCTRQSAFVLFWALVVSALHCTLREGNELIVIHSSRRDSDSPDARPFLISESLVRADRSRTVFMFLHVVRAADVRYSGVGGRFACIKHQFANWTAETIFHLAKHLLTGKSKLANLKKKIRACGALHHNTTNNIYVRFVAHPSLPTRSSHFCRCPLCMGTRGWATKQTGANSSRELYSMQILFMDVVISM